MAKWEKGQSGNVGGRPREIGDLRKLARERTQDALDTLTEVMLDKNAPSNARVAASTALLDRGYGKPTVGVEDVADNAPPIDLREAARRLAFIMNGAILRGDVVDVIPDETEPDDAPNS